MSAPTEAVTVTLPRSVVADLPALSEELTARMHDLLERNTDGTLSAIERAELETLVRMAQFAQILSLVASAAAAP